MGKIVGATLCTHVPRLTLSPEKRQAYMGKKVSTFYHAMEKMFEEKIKLLDFDTFLIFDTHWWTTLEFIINGDETHRGIYTSDEIPWLINHCDYNYSGNPELADLISEEGKQKKLSVYVSRGEGVPVHYPTLVTMRYFNADGKKRVLPMSIVYTSSIKDELDYGESIRLAIERSDCKVVIVATGGLSHKFWPLHMIRRRNSADLADISSDQNREFDALMLNWLKLGDHRYVLSMAEEFKIRCSPEGRFAHYLRMVGALGGENCRIKATQYGEYEAAAGTGQAILWFDIPENG